MQNKAPVAEAPVMEIGNPVAPARLDPYEGPGTHQCLSSTTTHAKGRVKQGRHQLRHAGTDIFSQAVSDDRSKNGSSNVAYNQRAYPDIIPVVTLSVTPKHLHETSWWAPQCA